MIECDSVGCVERVNERKAPPGWVVVTSQPAEYVSTTTGHSTMHFCPECARRVVESFKVPASLRV